MQYDSIILELMSRIKKLEDEVAGLKNRVSELETSSASNENLQTPNDETEQHDGGSYTRTRMTDEMIHACYVMGKNAFQNRGANLWTLADQASTQTGVNRNSAFMYICAVKCLLEGTVYKRHINAKALKRYFDNIFEEYGSDGLARALNATQLNIEYRKQLGVPYDSIVKICDEYKRKL